MLDANDEANDAIDEARTSADPARAASAKNRRIVGPATRLRIRATLRSAITTYMKQQRCRPGWACQKISVPAGSPIVVVTAATDSQVRAGCRRGHQPARTQRGERRHQRVLIGIGRQGF